MTAIRSGVVVGSLLCICMVSALTVSADSWPAWRGAAGDGVSRETDLPVSWSIDKNLAWMTELPGRGNSSPAVTSDRIYLTTQNDDHSLWVIAVDRRSGKIVGEIEVGSGQLRATGTKSLYAHRHNPATPSPTADGRHVWAFFGTGLLVCLDRSGTVQWKRDLAKDYGQYDIRFGMASSPRLWGDLLYVACMHKGPSYVVALEKTTGKEVWKTARKLPAEHDGPDAYSTPVVLRTKDRTELLVAGSDHVNAYDLLSGEQLWISSGLKIDSHFGRILASPAVSEDVVVASSGNPPPGGFGRMIALRTGGSGDITNTHHLWTYKPYTPDAPTPVCYEGRLYAVRDDGIGSCLDLKTGKVYWRKRLGKGPYRPSVVAGDKKVYFLNRDGTCTVIESGSAGKVLAENKLPGTFFATPAISDGSIYLRGHHRLYAIGGRNASTDPRNTEQ